MLHKSNLYIWQIKLDIIVKKKKKKDDEKATTFTFWYNITVSQSITGGLFATIKMIEIIKLTNFSHILTQ